MARNIIILDSSASMRRIMKTMVLATINDAIVSEAHDAREAREMVEGGRYHLVLFSKESSSKKWLEFANKRIFLPDGKKTAFVLFTSSAREDFFVELRGYGIMEHLVVPCAAEQVGEVVSRACSNYAMRESRRYSVLNAYATLEQGSSSFPAELVNFSLGGASCELDFTPQLNWAMPLIVNMKLAIDGVDFCVSGLYAFPRKLMVVTSNADYTPKRIRVALRFILVPETSRKDLSKLIEKAESHKAW